jgi:hypothetical protein
VALCCIAGWQPASVTQSGKSCAPCALWPSDLCCLRRLLFTLLCVEDEVQLLLGPLAYVCCHLPRLFAAHLNFDGSGRQSGRQKRCGRLDAVADLPLLCAVPDVDLRAVRAIGVIALPALLRPITRSTRRVSYGRSPASLTISSERRRAWCTTATLAGVAASRLCVKSNQSLLRGRCRLPTGETAECHSALQFFPAISIRASCPARAPGTPTCRPPLQ